MGGRFKSAVEFAGDQWRERPGGSGLLTSLDDLITCVFVASGK